MTTIVQEAPANALTKSENGRIEMWRLTAPVPAELAAMTFPIYRRLLALEPTSRHPEQGDRRQIQPLAITAGYDGDPSGLILAELPIAGEPAPGSCRSGGGEEDANTVQVLSVYVRPAWRHRGIAAALFAELERQVQALDFPALAAVYTAGKPDIVHLERILEHRGWSEPRPRTLSVRFTPEAAFASDLLIERRLRIQARGLEIFPWSELGDDERAEMERSQRENPWIAPGLVPWHFDQGGFDPSSVGARYRGRVVGWVITHRVGFDKVRFTCSFMRPDLSRRGRILPLYATVLERLRETPCRLCTFVTPFSYPPMVEFIRRRLAPISTFVGETRESRRTFLRRQPAEQDI